MEERIERISTYISEDVRFAMDMPMSSRVRMKDTWYTLPKDLDDETIHIIVWNVTSSTSRPAKYIPDKRYISVAIVDGNPDPKDYPVNSEMFLRKTEEYLDQIIKPSIHVPPPVRSYRGGRTPHYPTKSS